MSRSRGGGALTPPARPTLRCKRLLGVTKDLTACVEVSDAFECINRGEPESPTGERVDRLLVLSRGQVVTGYERRATLLRCGQ